jgi:hypothetical protein
MLRSNIITIKLSGGLFFGQSNGLIDPGVAARLMARIPPPLATGKRQSPPPGLQNPFDILALSNFWRFVTVSSPVVQAGTARRKSRFCPMPRYAGIAFYPIVSLLTAVKAAAKFAVIDWRPCSAR